MIYDEKTINAIKEKLTRNKQTIAVAESVTAGHIQAALSAGVEAAKYFQGGITAYNLGQKARHLNIDPILCEKENCVALQVAEAMAKEVSKMFISDYGLGITGYASIVPECEEEGLFAFIAISHHNTILHSGKIKSSRIIPFDVQVDYTNVLLNKLLDFI